MEKISDQIIEILDMLKESIELNCPNDEEELHRIKKIKEYIQSFEAEEEKNN